MIRGYLRTLGTLAGFVCIVYTVFIFAGAGALFSGFEFGTPSENWGIAGFIAVVFFGIASSGVHVMRTTLDGDQ